MSIVKGPSNNRDLVVTMPGGHGLICKLIQSQSQPQPQSQNSDQQQQKQIVLSTSSSSASLSDLSSIENTSNNTTIPTQKIEQIINFSNELTTNDLVMSTYLIANVSFDKSDQYAYLFTVNGQIIFFKMNSTTTTTDSDCNNKKPIWQLNINALIIKYYKFDINVSLICFFLSFLLCELTR
jgi:hypothetical protein